MTITTFDLMRLCVAILRSGVSGLTDAGPRVYTPGDWPGADKTVPYIRARSTGEDGESLGRNGARFTVTGTIQFSIYAGEAAVGGDAAAATLDCDLQRMARQIETALIGNPLLMMNIQQIPFKRARDVYDASGAQHYGAIEYLLGVEFYQASDEDDFYVPPVAALGQVVIDADLQNIFDPSGTYTTTVFPPGSATPAPRASGPDGRPEATATVIFPPPS
jgi:hypothetical protein